MIIIGAGQYGMVAKEIAEELGHSVIFLDNHSPLAVGKPEDVNESAGDVVIAIGSPDCRRKLMAVVKDRLVSLISPHAFVSPSANISPGCIIEPMAVVHTGAKVGRCCFISAGAVVNHNCEVGDFSHIDCNATVMRASVVPMDTKVEANTSYA